VSIVYIGYGVGAGLTFFINDRLGRIWSYRLYNLVYIVGTLIAMFAPNLGVLYAGRVVQGLGLGPLTVLGTMAIVEIAPPQIRGLLASWFNLAMGIGLVLATACTLGCYRHVTPSKLQFQIVMLVPMVYLAMVMIGTLFVEESPRWLFLVNRREEAVAGLARIRGLPVEDPRVQGEIAEIEADINRIAEAEGNNAGLWTIVKETFSTSSNLRRVQQSLMTYALAQLSGANLITSYFIPIMAIVGVSTSTDNSLFLSTMYGTSKFFFLLIATFLLIDLIGRRASLFAGATVQMLTHIYLAVYIKISQERQVSNAASQGAVAALFIHAFGYAIGEDS
jgi:MFS family permease